MSRDYWSMLADLHRLEDVIPRELQKCHTPEENNQRAGGHLYGGGLFRRALEQWLAAFVGDEDRCCQRHGILGVRELALAMLTEGSMMSAKRLMLDESRPRDERLFFAGVYDSFAALCSAVDHATRELPPTLWQCLMVPSAEFRDLTRDLAATLAGTVDDVFGKYITLPDELPEDLR